jgi:hypothetical protein
MHITPQCRHLPIGMSLLVDQAHIHDILAAVANSCLRVQITQVTLQHETGAGGSAPSTGAQGPGLSGVAKSGTRAPVGGGGPGAMSGVGTSPRPMNPGSGGRLGGDRRGEGSGMGMSMARAMMGRNLGTTFMPGRAGMGGGMSTDAAGGPGMGPTGGVGTGAEGVSTYRDNAQLVELSIYGIASIYERFPPKPKSDAPATSTTGTTTK